MYVCEDEGDILASAIINHQQVDVYADGDFIYEAPDNEIMVIHTLTVDPQARRYRFLLCCFLYGSILQSSSQVQSYFCSYYHLRILNTPIRILLQVLTNERFCGNINV